MLCINYTPNAYASAARKSLPFNPLRHVQTAVARRCAIDNSVFSPDLALTIDEALRAITVNAARQIGLEHAIAALQRDMEADLAILDSDPYETDPQNLMTITITETWVAGEKKFG